MSSLRVRGGGGGGQAIVSQSSKTKLHSTAAKNRDGDSADDDDKSSTKMSRQALRSIDSCVKMCLFAVFGDVVILFADRAIWSKFFGGGGPTTTTSLSWVDYADIFDSLSLLAFGMGLWRISRLYLLSIGNNTKEGMSHESLLFDLFSTMSWTWGVISLNMALACVTTAATLPAHAIAAATTGGGPLFRFLSDGGVVTPSKLSAAVATVLAIGAVAMHGRCERTADTEFRAFVEKHGIDPGKLSLSSVVGNGDKPIMFDTVRAMGFRAYRNQALCGGSIAIMACLQLARWIVSIPLPLSIVGFVPHVFGVFEFLTPFAITALLFALNKALLRAAITITEISSSSSSAAADDDQTEIIDGEDENEIYRDLFAAQAGFYGRVAEFLKSATVFRLLPYIMARLIPPILKALPKFSFVATAIDALGL